MLVINDLKKQLGEFQLDISNIHLPKGYIMGLIGENGAGKTSLIRCLLNMYRRDCGEILVDGNSIDKNEAIVKDRLGVVLEASLYEKNMSGLDNANIYGRLFSNYQEQVFLKYMSRFDVDPKKKLKKLSKGMELKFQIAMALSHDAKLLILDEPAGNLDEHSRAELSGALQEFIGDGQRSVLLSTHITSQLDEIADYITYLHSGKIIFSKDIESLKEDYRIVSGEDYKIRLLPSHLVIGVKKAAYSTEALVKYNGRLQQNKELIMTAPTIEQIMYYMNQGGFQNV